MEDRYEDFEIVAKTYSEGPEEMGDVQIRHVSGGAEIIACAEDGALWFRLTRRDCIALRDALTDIIDVSLYDREEKESE